MPKIIIHSPEGIFDAAARAAVAAELADFAPGCEGLPNSPFVRSTVWTLFNAYPADAVFMGGRRAYLGIVSAQLFTIAGGLDAEAKKRLISGVTDILGRHSGAQEKPPVYVVVQEIPEANWGFFGETADLAALRASSPDAPAL